MENREFLITYYRKDADVEDIRRFRTLKHLSDWFNSNIEPIVIIGIQEIPGDPWYDKYFKKGEGNEKRNRIS